MRTMRAAALAALFGLFLTGVLSAQDERRRGDDSPTGSDRLDAQTFVHKAAMGGMAEVKLGKLGMERASNPDVKRFAQMMVNDHSQANAKLIQLATSKNIPIDQDATAGRTGAGAGRTGAGRTGDTGRGDAAHDMKLDAKHQEKIDELSKLQGADFDKKFMECMLKDHKEAVSMFEKASRSLTDTDLKNFASQTLPKLRDHLQMAQNIASKVGAGTGDGHNP
jgi:putative membrane protein